MGKHREIESTLLREIALGEQRAKRAINVIKLQNEKISKLEEEIEQQKDLMEKSSKVSLGREAEEIESFLRIQTEIMDIQNSLMEIRELKTEVPAADLPKPYLLTTQTSTPRINVGSIAVQTESDHVEKVNAATSSIAVQMEDKGTLTVMPPPDMSPTVDAKDLGDIVTDLRKVQENLVVQRETDVNIESNLTGLREKVNWLREERNEVISFLSELSDWRKRVEGILLDLTSGMYTETGDVGAAMIENVKKDTPKTPNCPNTVNFSSPPHKAPEESPDLTDYKRRIWRTARQFFTAEQSHFLLSSTCDSFMVEGNGQSNNNQNYLNENHS